MDKRAFETLRPAQQLAEIWEALIDIRLSGGGAGADIDKNFFVRMPPSQRLAEIWEVLDGIRLNNGTVAGIGFEPVEGAFHAIRDRASGPLYYIENTANGGSALSVKGVTSALFVEAVNGVPLIITRELGTVPLATFSFGLLNEEALAIHIDGSIVAREGTATENTILSATILNYLFGNKDGALYRIQNNHASGLALDVVGFVGGLSAGSTNGPAIIAGRDTVGTIATFNFLLDEQFAILTNGTVTITGVQVLRARIGGWGADPGSPVRNSLTALSTQAEHNDSLRALIQDLRTHGLIGT